MTDGHHSTIEQTKTEAKEAARAAADMAREHGSRTMESMKEKTAEGAEAAARAVEATAEQLEREEHESLSGYARSLASTMRRLAGGLREHEVDEFAAELMDFARRRPGTFIAGSVALGFGLSRIMKATPHRDEGWLMDEPEPVGEPMPESTSEQTTEPFREPMGEPAMARGEQTSDPLTEPEPMTGEPMSERGRKGPEETGPTGPAPY